MVPRTVSHYEIVEKLGAGGMGVVYKAHDTLLRRNVALKVVPAEFTANESRRERLLREARATSALAHPNIVTIHDVVSEDSSDYIVMEYLEGRSLAELIQGDGLPLEEAVDYGIQIAEALAAAHGAGVIHRDLKPANVMVIGEGQVKVLDFGLAKLAPKAEADAPTETAMASLTEVGQIVGTAHFMSPEQALGEPVDARSDIFSLGAMLFQMLAGRPPFEAESKISVMHRLIYEEPTPLAGLRPDLPNGAAEVIAKALEKRPEDRYQSMQEVASALRGLRDGEPHRTLPGWKRLPRRAGRMAALLLLAVGLAWLGFQAIPSWSPGAPAGGRSLPAQKHIAVLPLANIGMGAGDTGQAFADGLLETLSSKLTGLERFQGSLWVVPASEIRTREVASVAEAQRAFAVTLAVTGSVQRSADRIRLTLNLVDARTLRQLKSAIIDHRADNLTALQDGASIKLADMLEVEVEPRALEDLSAGGTSEATAYDLYLQARGFLRRYDRPGNLESAVARLEQALGRDPSYALAYASLGEAHWRLYEGSADPIHVDKCREACDRALELDPRLAPVHVTLGILETGTGRYAEAITAFERALELDPRSAAAHGGLASAYEKTGQLELAESTFNRAIDLRPGYWDGYNELGLFYYRQGRYEDALSAFRRVVEVSPSNYKGYNNVGGILTYLERTEEARSMFERSLQAEPNYRALSNLGTLHFAAERYVEATEIYERALEFDGYTHVVVINLASAYHWVGNRDKARETYARAADMLEEKLEVNPNDALLLATLAQCYSLSGRQDEVPEYLERALRLGPDNVEVLIRVAESYEHIGRRDLALEWVRRAVDAGYAEALVEQNPALRHLRADRRYRREAGT